MNANRLAELIGELDQPERRVDALSELRSFGQSGLRAVERIIPLLNDDDPHVQEAAARTFLCVLGNSPTQTQFDERINRLCVSIIAIGVGLIVHVLHYIFTASL
jgi:hypothetical protein